jgi:hypothetical protein
MSSWVLKKARVSWRQEAGCDLVFKEVDEQERGKGKGKRKLGVVVPAPCFALSFFLLSAGSLGLPRASDPQNVQL